MKVSAWPEMQYVDRAFYFFVYCLYKICENFVVRGEKWMLSKKIARLLIAFVFLFLLSFVSEAGVFEDVQSNHEHAEAIDYLSKEGIINGYPDGSFRPELEVNRAEALKILLLANGITESVQYGNQFPDVIQDDWFAPFIALAREREIVDGYPDGFFRPEEKVNLVEATKMLLTAGNVDLQNYTTERQLFEDTESIAWYIPFLAYAKKFEMLEPDEENKVFPSKKLTRGELAELAYRFILRRDRVCSKFLENIKTRPTDYFENVLLNNELPNLFYEDEVFLLSGSVVGEASHATAVFVNDLQVRTAFVDELDGGKKFEISVEFKEPGLYQFAVLPDLSGKSYVANIEVLPRECAPTPVELSLNQPKNLSVEIEKGLPIFSWDNGENNLIRIVLRQGDRRFERLLSVGQSSFSPDPADFLGWEEGPASLQIFGAKSENGFSYEPRTKWAGTEVLNLQIGRHYFSVWDEEDFLLENLPARNTQAVNISGTTKVDIEPTAYLITPKGLVDEITIVDGVEKISAGSSFAFDLDLSETGDYILEFNNTEGIAVLNHPLYAQGTTPLLPDFNDLREPLNPKIKLSVNRERAAWLKLLNDFRRKQGLNVLKLDEKLNSLAQAYAERMAEEDFLAHIDPDGKNPEERAQAAGIENPIGENLARESKTEYAHEGLLRSATHRSNILTPEWTHVGLGVAKNDKGELFFVQEFSVGSTAAE